MSISDEKVKELLINKGKVRANAYNTQVAYGKDGHNFSSSKFLEIMKSEEKGEKALSKIIPMIEDRFYLIELLLENIPEEYNGYVVCSRERKQLYLIQMRERLEKLLLPLIV